MKRGARICTSCRTLLDAGEKCPGKNHHTADLSTTTGRNQIEEEVWGPDSRARALRQAARAGAGGAGIGGIFEGCDLGGGGVSSCDASGEAILGAIAVVIAMAVLAVTFMVLWWIIKAIIKAVRNAMDVPRPHGALLDPPKTKSVIAGRGVVKTGTPIATPWSAGGNTLAYAMELYENRVFGGGAMLRDASTSGFEVALDDGRTLRVPAGRIRIMGKRTKVETDSSRVDAFIKEIDVERMETDKTIVPYDFARAVTIDPGDRVEVLGDVDLTSGAEGGDAGYRANAGMVVPVGIPVLRVFKNAASTEPRMRIGNDPTAPEASLGDEEEAVQEEAESSSSQGAGGR